MRAERQLAGRGRQGRPWASPPGNLYASHLVRLRAGDPPPATLALTAAVALEETIAGLHPSIPVRLKWPNDLLADGAKLSGMLLEREGDAVVIGIGINVAHHPDLPDRATTDLAALGIAITPAVLLVRLAEMMAAWVSIWRGEGLAPIIERWSGRAHPVGTRLVARLPDGEAIEGAFAGLLPDGALSLRLADGASRAIHAGDVFLI